MKRWTKAEDEAVKAFYGYERRGWDGWKEVLPDRPYSSIKYRAAYLRRIDEQYREETAALRTPKDEDEGYDGTWGEVVQHLMEKGLSPSQIDARMGWKDGRAKGLLMGTWRDE